MAVKLTATAFLEQADAAPFAGLPDIVGEGGVVVLAPHPDDESLGCGGLLAEAAAAGRGLRVIFISDGGASHPTEGAEDRAALSRIRQAEALEALACLGVPASDAVFLGLPDAAVPEAGAAFDVAVGAVRDALRSTSAGALLTTWEHDPHCDHHAAWAMARAALTARPPGAPPCRLVQYSVWGHTLPPDHALPGPAPQARRLDVRRHLAAKARALACHRSQFGQVASLAAGRFQVDAALLDRCMRDFELFLLQEGDLT